MRLDGPSPFEFATDGNCGFDWKIWLRGFEIYAQANKVSDPTDKLNWMLHYAGTKVQNVFYALPETEESGNENAASTKVISSGPRASGYWIVEPDCFEKAVLKLNRFFEPKQNISYERHLFRQLKQNTNERIDMFLMRLREQAERCDFGDQLDGNIRDQITSGCASDILRRKMLERGDEPLAKLIQMAQTIELVHKQQMSFGRSPATLTDSNRMEAKESEICKIETRRRFGLNRNAVNRNFEGECGRCGLKGHKSVDDKCPAKGKTCNHCGRKDHFARKCFVKGKQTAKTTANRKRPNDSGNFDEPHGKVKRESIQMMDAQATDQSKGVEDEYEDLFCIESKAVSNKIWCSIGGIDVQAIVDSGSRYNVIDRASWIELKAKNIQTIHRQKEVDVNFRAYGGHPLKLLGMIKAIVRTPQKQMEADFYVADEFGKVLLGFDTAVALGVLSIGTEMKASPSTTEVNTVDSKKAFTKIKNVVLDIPIKADVKGVAQPYRRVPAPLEKLVDEKIEEMFQQGIIEKVNGVSKWISQMVIAPKDDNDVRICVDMRRANTAIERENHPLPTMDDFLPQLNDAKLFSKLDVKQAYHQVK